MITPFYFGRSSRPLFGIFHAPAATRPRPSAVLVCPPIGHEYMRTHRALRTLAAQLARAGHGVLRFDWSGTGDSAGEPETASVTGWLEDFAAAADELGELVPGAAVHAVGLRLGATLAAAGAAETRLDTLVLWDPVAAGPAFLEELSLKSGRAPHPPAPGVTLSLAGFPVNRRLWEEIAHLELGSVARCRAGRLALVVSEGKGAPLARYLEVVQLSGVPVSRREVAREGDWDDMDRLGAALLPRRVLDAIGKELG